MAETLGVPAKLAVSERVRILLESVHLDELCVELVDEIKGLEADARMLQALESWGVDNWSGYSEAYAEAHEGEMEDW